MKRKKRKEGINLALFIECALWANIRQLPVFALQPMSLNSIYNHTVSFSGVQNYIFWLYVNSVRAPVERVYYVH